MNVPKLPVFIEAFQAHDIFLQELDCILSEHVMAIHCGSAGYFSLLEFLATLFNLHFYTKCLFCFSCFLLLFLVKEIVFSIGNLTSCFFAL